jgi:uncharacterized protein YuzE
MKDGSEPLVGLVGEVGEGRVTLDIDGNRKVVAIGEIKKAKLVIEF